MKRLTVLIVLLLVGSALGADYCETRTDYIKQARRKCGVDTANNGYLSDSVGSYFLTEAVIVTMPLVKASQKVTQITTTYRENSYALDTTLLLIDGVWFEHLDTVKPLRYLPMGQWGEKEHKTTKGQKDPLLQRPSYYDYTDSLLLVYPTPGLKALEGDTIKIKASHKVPDVSTEDTLTAIPQKYRPAVVTYLAYKAAFARDDKQKYDQFWAEWQAMVAILKQEVVVEAGK